MDTTRLLQAATSRRTPNAPWAPGVEMYAALGWTPALHPWPDFAQVNSIAADPGMSAGLRAAGLLDVLSNPAAKLFHRAPYGHASLKSSAVWDV